MAKRQEPPKNQIAEIVRTFLPPHWHLVQEGSIEQDAYADFATCTIHCPKVEDKYTLGIFLHECAHVIFKHRGRHPAMPNARYLPRHVEEYQAENWSINILRAYGYEPSRLYMWNSRLYVSDMIKEDESNGEPIEPKIRRWCGNVT